MNSKRTGIVANTGWVYMLCLLLLYPQIYLSAQNLVPNPGFEIYTSCPQNQAELIKATPWDKVNNHNGSPDFFHTCGVSFVGVPTNNWGYQYAATGLGYSGLLNFASSSSNAREYMQAPLSAPLVANMLYQVSLKYAVCNKSSVFCPNLHVFFSTTAVTGSGNIFNLNYIPQVSFNNVTYDTLNWATVTQTFTAAGNEQYITIGNFYNDMNSTSMSVGIGGFSASYLYIDDISVKPVDCQVALGNDTTICSGDQLLLNPNLNTGSFLWQDNSTNPVFNVTQPGIYWVTVTTSNCTGSDTIQVNMVNRPTIQLGPDTFLCIPDSIILNASYPNATYLWQNGSTQPLFTAKSQGLYYVRVFDQTCSGSDSIYIAADQKPEIDLGSDTSICEHTPYTLIPGAPNFKYIWQDGNTGSQYNVQLSGIYWVLAQVKNCFSTDTVQVTVLDNPVIDLGADQQLCSGDTYKLNLPGLYQYLWNDGDISAIKTIGQAGVYWVRATQGLCSAADTVTFRDDCNCRYKLPTAFSPNGDGINDEFTGRFNCIISEFHIQVYNRLGQVIFESTDPAKGWDGNYNRKKQPVGVYAYKLRYRIKGSDMQTMSGNLTLVD